MRLWTVIFALLLTLQLGACKSFTAPSGEVLREALSLQLQLTRSLISNSIEPEIPQRARIKRVRVENRSFVALGEKDDALLRINGFFDWQIRNDVVNVEIPFELFLEKGSKGESWRLARPIGSVDNLSQRWITYALPIP